MVASSGEKAKSMFTVVPPPIVSPLRRMMPLSEVAALFCWNIRVE